MTVIIERKYLRKCLRKLCESRTGKPNPLKTLAKVRRHFCEDVSPIPPNVTFAPFGQREMTVI